MEQKNTFVAYGLITGVVMVIISLLLYVTGLMFKQEFRYIYIVSYGVFLTGLILNAVAFSKSRDGFVTFGNVFGNCFKATLIIMVLLVVWNAIASYVFPEMKDRLIDMRREQMMQNKDMTDEQIDMAMDMTKKYWTLFMYLGSIIGTMIIGAIFSLVAAAVAKKKGEDMITATNT